jgi:hypothetical protein
MKKEKSTFHTLSRSSQHRTQLCSEHRALSLASRVRLGNKGRVDLVMGLAKVDAPERLLDRVILNRAAVFVGLVILAFCYSIEPELRKSCFLH